MIRRISTKLSRAFSDAHESSHRPRRKARSAVLNRESSTQSEGRQREVGRQTEGGGERGQTEREGGGNAGRQREEDVSVTRVGSGSSKGEV